MRTSTVYRLGIGILVVLVAFVGSRELHAQEPAESDEHVIRMARATWDTGWFQAEVYKVLLERLGYTVEGPATMDNPDFYAAAARGDVDVWVNGWFPLHNNFINQSSVQGNVDVIGYQVGAGALQGYLVDKETAEAYDITTLADLQDPEIAAIFDADGNGLADLIGCNEGWGCEPVVDHHIDAYDLQETVEQIQGDYSPLMADTVERYERGEPILFYTWTPNWTVGTLVPGEDVIWLEVPFASMPAGQTATEDEIAVDGVRGCVDDPCAMGFPPNDIRVVANSTFLDENPAARMLLASVEIPLSDIHDQNARMLAGEDDEEAIHSHAVEWIQDNATVVENWLTPAQEIARANGITPPSDDAGSDAEIAPVSGTDTDGEDDTLRVVTQRFEPFVIYENREYTGFSIELWDLIAEEMGVDYELYGVNTIAKMLDEVERDAADVATAGIGITSKRERNLDFSHPYFESGFQIMVRDTSGGLFHGLLPALLSTVFAPELLFVLGLLLFSLILAAHIIWLLERRHNPEFPDSYLRGIWESVWWAAVTITTVGYGDKTPKKRLGRLFGLIWIFAGYFVFAYFTASVTSTITLQELAGQINGPEDLPGKTVATVSRSAAADYLNRQGLRTREFDDIDDAYSALENDSVDAIVYDAPVLQYYASHDGQGQVRVVGLVFQELNYGIATQFDSPYRKRINLALLRLIETGQYQELYDTWFGRNDE